MGQQFQEGDIFAVRGKGLLAWLSSKLFYPPSDRFHFGIIGGWVSWDNDYIILESITRKGPTLGRLSMYRMEDLEVYRLRDPDWQELGERAVIEATKYGRFPYDYFLPLKFALGAIRLVLSGKFPPWRPEEFPYTKNALLICTEMVNDAYAAVGRPIIPVGVCPLPAGFESALMAMKLVKVFPKEGNEAGLI